MTCMSSSRDIPLVSKGKQRVRERRVARKAEGSSAGQRRTFERKTLPVAH